MKKGTQNIAIAVVAVVAIVVIVGMVNSTTMTGAVIGTENTEIINVNRLEAQMINYMRSAEKNLDKQYGGDPQVLYTVITNSRNNMLGINMAVVRNGKVDMPLTADLIQGFRSEFYNPLNSGQLVAPTSADVARARLMASFVAEPAEWGKTERLMGLYDLEFSLGLSPDAARYHKISNAIKQTSVIQDAVEELRQQGVLGSFDYIVITEAKAHSPATLRRALEPVKFHAVSVVSMGLSGNWEFNAAKSATIAQNINGRLMTSGVSDAIVYAAGNPYDMLSAGGIAFAALAPNAEVGFNALIDETNAAGIYNYGGMGGGGML